MDGIEFIKATSDRLEAYAKKHNFSKEEGYSILVAQTLYKFGRLGDLIWISNPNGKNKAEEFTRKIDLASLQDAKKVTLNSKVNFLENFLLQCAKHKSEIRVLKFEETRKQRSQKQFTELLEAIKTVF